MNDLNFNDYKFKIIENIDDEDLLSMFSSDNVVYVKPGIYAMSTRKLEALIKIAYIQKYYQCNPVRFIDNFFNIELLDAQAYIVQRTWNCPNVLVLASRGFGKSTVIDLILMAKDMLFSNIWTYIASGTGGQAEQTFTKLEQIANDGIDEMKGSTGYIFKNEVSINNAAGDGFSHGSNGFKYTLYNGSFTQTLNSNIDAKRGARGSVVFDECGFLSDEMINVYGAFAAVNKNFALGKDRDGHSIDPIRLRTFATNIPNQKFYISSASDTSTKFYRLYREFSKKQIMGDRDYCVIQVDCDVVLNPTIHGEAVNALLSRSTIESEMQTNPEKARREYYCQFTSDAGAAAIIKRGVIARNSETRVPLLYNDTNDKKFVICYDPARSRDNSIILIMEIYMDSTTKEYKGRIVNCVNLIDIGKRRKTPMQTPDQIQYLKELILAYNGDAPDYENIEAIMIDAGSGGGGVNIADYLMEDWVDDRGRTHRGLIDKEYSADYVSKYPNAIDKVRLMSPSQFKSMMCEALIELMKILLNFVLNGTITGGVGELGNFIVGCAFVVPVAFVYQKWHNKIGMLAGMAVGIVCLVALGSVVNYFVLLPVYAVVYGQPLEAFIAMGHALNPAIIDLQTFILYAVAPFNLLKGIVISVLTVLLYNRIGKYLEK